MPPCRCNSSGAIQKIAPAGSALPAKTFKPTGLRMVPRTERPHTLHVRALTAPGAARLVSQLAAAMAQPWAFSFAIFLLASLIIGWPWLSGRVTIPWDAKAQFLPQIQFLAQSLARGESPAWTPFVFSGHPQIADPQSMIFSPPFLALALIDGAPSLWAQDATVLACAFLGGAALMLWFRDQRWHWAGALIAALAFSHGASMAWRIQHIGQVLSLAYLPMAMLCLDRALSRASIGYGIATGLVVAAMVLGRDQVALLGLYFLAGLAAWRLLTSAEPARALRRSAPPLVTGGACAGLLVAVPVLLTALLAHQSNRPSFDYVSAARGSLHPALLLTAVVPDVFAASGRMEDYWGPPSFAWPDTGLFLAQNMGELYMGALPLVLLLLAAVRGWLLAREARFFMGATAVALVYALGWYTPFFRALYALLPGVDLYRRPADAAFLLGALGATLAGYSLHRLCAAPDTSRQTVRVAAATLVMAFVPAIALALWLGRLPLIQLPLMAALIAFAAAAGALIWAGPRLANRPRLAVVALAGVLTLDLAYNNGPSSATAQPPARYDLLQPNTRNATIAILKSKVVTDEKRRDRIELAGLGFDWPNASLTHGLENTLGYNPIRLALYSQAVGAEDHVGLPEQRKFSALFPSYRSTLANLLGLRFIVTGVPIETIDTHLQGDLPLIARTTDGFIYENPDALPRVLFATAARAADFTRLIADGVWPEADLRSTVLLEHPPGADVSKPKRSGTARILRYRNTEVLVETDSPDGGFLVLNDLWHPWWFAEVDGRPAEMLRANVLFRAVAMPPARHTVRFIFRPVAAAVGLIGK
jgi:hypothetical protein